MHVTITGCMSLKFFLVFFDPIYCFSTLKCARMVLDILQYLTYLALMNN